MKARMNRWGTTAAPIKWAVVDAAPLTGSGLNEMMGAFRTRSEAVEFLKGLGPTAASRRQYDIIPVTLAVTTNGHLPR